VSDSASGAASGADGTAVDRTKPARSGKDAGQRGLFAQIALFLRQIVGELKKVVWPTRPELVTYTTVVVVFVLIVMAYVEVLDLGIGRAVLWVFGG
jgi:preprotein translocase subunit SecE